MQFRHVHTGQGKACHYVEIGEAFLGFSYQTLVFIGDKRTGNAMRSENQWGPTTGKHLGVLAVEFARYRRDHLLSDVPREIFDEYAPTMMREILDDSSACSMFAIRHAINAHQERQKEIHDAAKRARREERKRERAAKAQKNA